MSERTLGTCSICGGAVTLPLSWLGIHPPVPTCSTCGATPVHAHGPVIPMRPRQPSWSLSWQEIRYIYGPEPADPTIPVDYDSTFQWPLRHTTNC